MPFLYIVYIVYPTGNREKEKKWGREWRPLHFNFNDIILIASQHNIASNLPCNLNGLSNSMVLKYVPYPSSFQLYSTNRCVLANNTIDLFSIFFFMRDGPVVEQSFFFTLNLSISVEHNNMIKEI